MIKTQRLTLRSAQEDDVEALFDVFAHPEAMKYWDTPPHTLMSQTQGFVQGMINANPENCEDFVVVYEGKVIGKAGFWCLPEIGFIFHPDYWGKGLAKEAVSALIDFGFRQRKLTKITADVDPRNARSIGLLTSLGFVETHRETNTIKVGDVWCDSVYFALFENKYSGN